MQHGRLHSRIPSSVIFLVLGVIIFPIMIFIGQNFEGGILLVLFPGLFIGIICMGVGVVLGIIDLVEAYRNKRTWPS